MWVGTFQIKGALYKTDALTRTAIIKVHTVRDIKLASIDFGQVRVWVQLVSRVSLKGMSERPPYTRD